MTSLYKKVFRTPKEGETINYDCGCVYIITKIILTGGFDVEVSVFCQEHDPTLTEYAKEHYDEIDWSSV